MSITNNTSNFLAMFPVTYTFENGVYSTIVNQNSSGNILMDNCSRTVQNSIQTMQNTTADMQKLMVPFIDTTQMHIQTAPIQVLHSQPSSSSVCLIPTSASSSSPSSSSIAKSTPSKKYVNPFAPEATVPLPIELEDQFGPYSSSVWKRNERERCRVRNVNDGYDRLRKHLPVQFDEKRISKVDTLRLAIRYIRHLDNLLKNHLHQYNCKCFNGFQEESEGNILIDVSTFSYNSNNNNP